MPRVVLLGEDRAHRQFLTRLCERSGWRIEDEQFAPPGEDSASGWVLARFRDLVAQIDRYPDLALLTCIDGDGKDYVERRRQLVRRLGRPWPAAHALLVPCWAIDTWALFFADEVVLGERGEEAKKAKQRAAHVFRRRASGTLAPGVPRDRPAPPAFRPEALVSIVEGFLGPSRHAELPSLDRSRASFRKLS